MANSDDITVLHRKRGSMKATLTRFSNFVKEIKLSEPNRGNLTDLELRISKVESHLLSDFEAIQLQIENIEKEIFDFSETDKFESQYFSVLSEAKNTLSDFNKCLNNSNSNIAEHHSVTHSTSLGSNNFNPEIRLPTIELPKFDGVYERWAEFRDLFTSLIHENSHIKPISKFHYLRASLQGCAAQCIKSIEFSADSYQLAWDILNERFNNKRLMVHNHLKSILNIHDIKSESANNLRYLVDTLHKNLRSLKTLGLPTNHWDVLIIFIIVSKLDPGTVQDWKKFKLNAELPTLEEFTTFLKGKADLLEKIDLHKSKPQSKSKVRENYKALVANSKGISCFICNKNHLIYSCPDFTKMSANARQEQARQLKLCLNCMRKNHETSNCKAGNCRKCNAKHHTLLHFERSPSRPEQNKPNQPAPIPTPGSSLEMTETYHSRAVSKQILLSTAFVEVGNAWGNKYSVRALLDCGSMSNYISEKLFNKLGLSATSINCSVVGIGQIQCNLTSACDVEINSLHNTYSAKLRCLIISKITDNLPNFYFKPTSLNIPDHLQLADPKFNEPGEVDLLIGSSVFWDILCQGKVMLGKNKPVMHNTKLGWIISGSLNISNSEFDPLNRSTCNFNKSDVDIQNQLTKFWELEEILYKRCYSQEELQAEEHFVNNFKRDTTGRFIVSIPLKKPVNELGDSKQLALKRFYQLERKLCYNPKLKQMYTDFMREYKDLSHMSEYSDSSDKITYYSPHHGVFKEDSSSTKLRVVFNSSALSTTGISYNNLQMVGPTVQDDLTSILLRFRQHKFVVSADIAKMYRQVLVDDEFKPLQLIFWRSNPSSQLRTYSLNTVTYGTASAAFLATRCIKQLALEHQAKFPLASNVISRDFYVDDLLTGADTVEETVQLCKQVSSILKSGCFDLRKWKSNSPAVMDGIQSSISSTDILHLGPQDDAKILGLLWSCANDTFSFQEKIQPKPKSITKRVMLSETAQIFDPLGLTSPAVVIAKILLQRLWTLKLSWDEEIPATLASSWLQFRAELSELNLLEIPRHVICNDPISVELHGFADASQDAYGSCIYMRTKTYNNQITVRLICAKSRVAPLKSVTIPRLELCSAQMLAKLFDRITASMSLKFDNYYMWSDSTIVLAWIRTSPHVLQTFVANRVSNIQQLTEVRNWRHVPTEQNPADYLSRGLTPKNLVHCNTWFNGPDFLREEPLNWPTDISLSKPMSINEIPEIRKRTQTYLHNGLRESFPFERFSSLTRLKRTTAYVLRFINNLRKPKEYRLSGRPSLEEINHAFIRLIQLAQRETFPDEIEDILKDNMVSKKSNILNLSPFLDEAKTLRVGGRLRHSPYNFEKKHPALLSSKHRLTYLIFRHEHVKLLHSGPQLLLAAVKETAWPIAGRNLAKRVVRECVVCCRHNPKFLSPIMGNLPAPRVTPSPPFYNTGVDYAGPFTIKDRKGRGCKKIKCYICLFICLATKAIHLELVTDLSTQSFLETLQRFVSRRGRPSHIYSDNGSNFVGANAQLKELRKFLLGQMNDLSECFEKVLSINWHFIPAYSPHMGGIWEAGVKSAKHHIRRILSNTPLTFESFYTIITQIESILNSRPLTPLSVDSNDLEVLTPAHFLIGRSYLSIPEPNLGSIPTGRLSHYQHLQQLTQHFWTRWSKEYISQLQARVKWKSTQRNIEIGSIVVVKDDNLPPSRWCIGRVQELHPGSDHVVRVISVKTASGVIKRSVTKVCVLPVDTS